MRAALMPTAASTVDALGHGYAVDGLTVEQVSGVRMRAPAEVAAELDALVESGRAVYTSDGRYRLAADNEMDAGRWWCRGCGWRTDDTDDWWDHTRTCRRAKRRERALAAAADARRCEECGEIVHADGCRRLLPPVFASPRGGIG